MPKIEIDYSNTIIYKIVCKDETIKHVHVGHTTNFVQRKHAHKQACINVKSPSYNLKLYKMIREHGNWSNWEMSIVKFYKCKDILEAKQKEQEHFIALNSVEPFSGNINHNIQDHNTSLQLGENEKFNCVFCNYKSNKISEWKRHILTSKHKKNTDEYAAATSTQQKKHFCENCNKEYINRTGLWRHKKKCSTKIPDEVINHTKSPEKSPESNISSENEIIKMLIQENVEIKKLMLELIKKDTLTITNNTSTNNSHNKTFNLQFFLNEECKDALNISEFVSSIKVELDDLETTGRLGYVEGVSRIMNKNLKELDVNKRPIHCSDLKREVLYIKNDDQWIKEEETKPILKKAIKQVAHENIKQIAEWKKKYPDCTDADSRKNDTYLNIVSNSMSGLTTEEQVKNYEKIISNVAKEATIDK